MKKNYLTALALISLPILVNAQTITQADLPHAGTMFSTAHDGQYVAPVPAGGMGQSWDYSTLLNGSQDTSSFIDAAGTPYAGMFPGSNLANFTPSDTSYGYFTSNSSGFYINGVGSPSFTVTYDPPDLFIPVPFSFGSTHDNTSRLEIPTVYFDSLFNIFPARIIIRSETHFEGDATGSLVIPSGSYPNVLRVKITDLTYDSLEVDTSMGLGNYVFQSVNMSQVTHYRFLTSGYTVNYILGIDADSLGTTSTSSEYLLDANVSVPNIAAGKNAILYPNPVMSSINFKNLNDDASLVIYDSRGNEVMRIKAILNNKLNVDGLSNGVYHYEINQRDRVQKGSFVIQH